MITAMEVPDHSTIAEFRRRHQDRIAELFIEVLGLCSGAGLVRVGEIAIDGTKLRASASYDRNRGHASIVEEILEEAEQVDREEDERPARHEAMSFPSSSAPAAGRSSTPGSNDGVSASRSRSSASFV